MEGVDAVCDDISCLAGHCLFFGSQRQLLVFLWCGNGARSEYLITIGFGDVVQRTVFFGDICEIDNNIYCAFCYVVRRYRQGMIAKVAMKGLFVVRKSGEFCPGM